MSRETTNGLIADGLIMTGAAGSVLLLLVGAVSGTPAIAGAGTALALGATVAKLFGTGRHHQNGASGGGQIEQK
jgi:hypothetical protein